MKNETGKSRILLCVSLLFCIWYLFSAIAVWLTPASTQLKGNAYLVYATLSGLRWMGAEALSVLHLFILPVAFAVFCALSAGLSRKWSRGEKPAFCLPAALAGIPAFLEAALILMPFLMPSFASLYPAIHFRVLCYAAQMICCIALLFHCAKREAKKNEL